MTDSAPTPAIESTTLPETDPFVLFSRWLAEAEQAEPNDPTAMALATATPAGMPSLRMVLLKAHSPEGFVFYTNAESRKGEELATNPHVALLFHWKSLRRQIRIEGTVTAVSTEEVDTYFHSRPRVSQIGSAASDQSRPMPDRQTYLDRVAALEAKYPEGQEIPRPAQWQGYRVVPRAMEFWLSRDYRLHDRRRYVQEADSETWSSTLLFP